jgi:hypothetical protein
LACPSSRRAAEPDDAKPSGFPARPALALASLENLQAEWMVIPSMRLGSAGEQLGNGGDDP